jgi:nucleoside-diphosphate-sugar epimerase
MKVAVTGCGGRVGAAICRALALDPAVTSVLGLDRVDGPPARPGAWDLLPGGSAPPALQAAPVWRQRLDIAAPADAAALQAALRGAGAVVHVAALHAPHVGTVPDAEFERINVQGSQRVLDAAAAAGVRALVFTSTTALYGAGAQALAAQPAIGHGAGRALWVDERTPPAPQTVYHRSKLAAEALLQAAAAQHGPVLRVLRMSRCFVEPVPATALQRLHRGVDARDVAQAHRLALHDALHGELHVPLHGAPHAPDRATRSRSRTWIVSGAVPFARGDEAALWADAAALLRVRVPALAAAFEARGWPLPARIDRVYDPGRIAAELGFVPRHGWAAALTEGVGDPPA